MKECKDHSVDECKSNHEQDIQEPIWSNSATDKIAWDKGEKHESSEANLDVNDQEK